MSFLYPELDIDVVKITLTPKAGGSTVDYYFAQDYWGSGRVYTTNPVFYPLLVSIPLAQRGVDSVAGIKYSTQIQLYGDTHLTRYGKSFMDVLKDYEIHNALVKLLYYSKPSNAFAVTTHSDSVNTRAVMRVVSESFDEATGIMSIECSDMVFRDREISKKLGTSILTGLDANWNSEYGAIVFGQSTVSGDGIAIDAPYFDSKIDGSNRPVAKLFSGWTFPGHPNKAFKRLFVKNQYKDQNKDEWVVVSLESDPQTAGAGESVSSPAADPPNYARDLALYQRGIAVTPTTDAAKILTSASSKLVFKDTARCADIVDGQHFFNNSSPDMLSFGNSDFSGEVWVSFDTLHSGSFKRFIMRQGETNTGRASAEWALYFNTADDKIRFGISHNGTTYGKEVAWSSAASTSTVYQIVWYFDSTNQTINLVVNNGAVQTTALTFPSGDEPSSRKGVFSIGTNLAADAGFDGGMWMFRIWTRLLSGGEITSLYNSGIAIPYANLSDSLKVGIRCAYDLDEPYGLRHDAAGSADLSSNSTTTLLSREIGYAYANVTVFLGGEGGLPQCTVESAETLNSGDTVGQKNTSYRDAATATNNSNFYSSLTSGNGSTGYWNIDPPLVLAPSAKHLVTIDLDNQQDFLFALDCYYDSHSGSTHYAKDKQAKAANWGLQSDVRLDLQLYYLGQGDDAWTGGTTSGADRYAYQHLEAKSISLYDDVTRKTFAEELEFKICISGIQDDLVGTYTGTPSAIIEKPPHIVKFLLMNSDFGLGLSSMQVDTTSITTAVSDMDATYVNSLKMQIVIDGQTSAEEFLLEVCRQSRTIFYKKKSGELALKFLRYTTVMDFTFTEAYHRGDFILLSVVDNDFSTVVNDFDQLYKRETFFLPSDVSRTRSDPKVKLINEIVLNKSESTAGDVDRIAKCSASEALYDKREMKSDLKYYDSSTFAQTVQNYFCDRFARIQKRARFRVLRSEYYTNLDLFSMIRLQHTSIADTNGTADKATAYITGTNYPIYDEGLPCFSWAGGTVEGQVYEVVEQGPWMTITIETIDPYL